jgi:hypothetical protein
MSKSSAVLPASWRTARACLGCVVLSLAWADRAMAQDADPAPPGLAEDNPLESSPSGGKAAGTRPSCGFFETIGKSMFGKQTEPEREWTPLTLGNIGEGWFEAWIAPPSPSGGSLRQGWANTYDAFFNRMIVGIYSLGMVGGTKRNEAAGILLYETPITRRYLFGISLPDSLQNETTPVLAGLGDTTIENRFILQETRNATLSFNLNGTIPTGNPALGGHQTTLAPYLSYFQGLGCGFSLRGTGGIDLPLAGPTDGIAATPFQQVGIGQTLTPHDVPFFGNFTYYLTANASEFLGTRDATASLTPGFRMHLGRDYWLIGGVEVPVVGPRTFAEQLTFLLVKGF